MAELFDNYSQQPIEKRPIIYVYKESYLPGYLKVGYTVNPVEQRMAEIHPLKQPVKTWEVLYTESALYDDGSVFMDHDVHKALQAKGYDPVPDPNGGTTEFYQCSLDAVKAAIYAVKSRTVNAENRTETFGMRPEQERAVTKTAEYFKKTKQEDPNKSPKFLWNCKMRFGKTFASYCLAKQMGFKRILVLTFKPAVEDSWETDLMHHVAFEGWQFYSRKTEALAGVRPEMLDKSRPIVCFGSFQDFLGTNDAGGIKAKNEWVHATQWDMVIFDEYHFGAWRDNAKKLFDTGSEDDYDSLDIEKYAEDEANNAYNESFLPITTDYYLFLSGTPFRSLNNGEFMEDQIFSWTYSDEQREKINWKPEDHNGMANPYLELPRVIMMTYKMPDEIERVAKNTDTNEFDLNEFFKAKVDNKDVQNAEFIHKDEVQKWLDLIRGSYLPTSLDQLRLGKGERPVLPFSDVRMKGLLLHTLWFLPNVASCFAMANLLKEKQNVFYHEYTVNVCAGTGAGIGLAAVKPVRHSMTPALDTKSITLSCGKLTTGVTVKPWTGIFMLRNLSSPETYFQAAFRVQSPWTIKNEDGSKEIIKENAYIFDFAVNRALKQISDYSTKLDTHGGSQEQKVDDFVRFLPVLAYDGSTMKPIDASEILDMVTAGTSASLLARRWQSALLVNVDNSTLQKLLDNEKAMKALMNIEAFRNLNKDIATIINKSEHVKKTKKEHGENLTQKQKHELSQEEKEFKTKRKEIQEKLIKFATRIPIFMYLTDYREQSLKDVIVKLEPTLFRKVTGLTIDDFELLVSLGVFNEALMNDAIWQFRRYEENSLEYTGITKHSPNENVGLFSTSITRSEYEKLSEEQGLSMDYKKIVQQIHSPKKDAHIQVTPEMDNALINAGAKKMQKQSSSPEKPAQQSPTYKVVHAAAINNGKKTVSRFRDKVHIGTRVSHKTFGNGTVTQRDGDKIKVDFDEIGSKEFKLIAFDSGFLRLL